MFEKAKQIFQSVVGENKDRLTKVKDFQARNRNYREARSHNFKKTADFVLRNQQWTADEKKEKLGDPTLTFNFSEDYVEKFMSRLFPRSTRTGVMDVGVKIFDTDDETKRTKYENDVLDTYRNNSVPTILLEQGTDYLTGGAGCLYFPKDPKTGLAKILSINPATVSIEFDGQEVIAFSFIQTLPDLVERITYWDLNEMLVVDNGVVTKVFKNVYDFVPFAWIPNYPVPHDKQYIRSKIDSLHGLDKEYNEIGSKFSKRVIDNTEPPMNVYSNKLSKDKPIQRGSGKTNYAGEDDKIEFLELKEGREVLDYMGHVLSRMKSKTGILDSAGSVKSALSGVSFAFQYSDMLDHIGFMRIFWDQGFRKMNQAILTYANGKGEYNTDPVYNQPFQFDEKSRVENYDKMLEMRVISRRDVIEELRGSENPDQKLQEIEEENKQYAEPVVEQKTGEEVDGEK